MIAARKQPYAVLQPWGRPWWSCWHDRVRSGLSVAVMTALAERGRAFQISEADAPTEAAKAALVGVPVATDAFTAWTVYFRQSGIRLPAPQRVRIVFMPDRVPPSWQAPIMARSKVRA